MSAPPFMPLYVADYLGDTGHLTTEQHGAYLLLLMAMWRAGGRLPHEREKLARFARLSLTKWGRLEVDILALFDVTGTQITHKRLDHELQKSAKISEVRKKAGAAGASAKAMKNKDTADSLALANPQQSESIHNHISESQIQTPISPDGEIAPLKGGSKRKPKAAKFVTVPDDWEPKDSHRAKVLELGLTVEQARAELAKFREWEFKDAKVNIDLAFHRWLREAVKRMRSQPHGRGSSDQPNSSGERHLAALRPLAGGAQAALDRRRGRKWGV